MKNNACLPNLEPIVAAGINPKTGLPIKMGPVEGCGSKESIMRLMRNIDLQDATNRFIWYNLPEGMDGELIERILFFKGQGMFFYMKSDEKFYFLPYALDGTIDIYGRFTGVTPLPFNGSDDAKGPWIKGLTKTPVYSVRIEDMTLDDYENSCALLSDYGKGISQMIIPRSLLNEDLLSLESDCIPFMHTALLNSTGIQGMRVNSQDEQSNVELASRSVNDAALRGRKWIAVTGNLEFQDLSGGTVGAAQDFMLAMEELDNFRLKTYGLTGTSGGGVFQKTSYISDTQNAINQEGGGALESHLRDGLRQRQNFCNIVNSLWGLGIWCDTAENAAMAEAMIASEENPAEGTIEGGEEDV